MTDLQAAAERRRLRRVEDGYGRSHEVQCSEYFMPAQEFEDLVTLADAYLALVPDLVETLRHSRDVLFTAIEASTAGIPEFDPRTHTTIVRCDKTLAKSAALGVKP